MPRGTIQEEYFANPAIDKPIGEIYRDLDAFTWEHFADEPRAATETYAWVLLPPLSHEGRFVKGILFSQGADWLLSALPEVQERFLVIATSMWSSYPWTGRADGYAVLYRNPERERWFRENCPDRRAKVLIPLEGSELHFNENRFTPLRTAPDLDVLAVGRLTPSKNLPMLAEAVQICRRKYPEHERLRLTLVTNHPWGSPDCRLSKHEETELLRIERVAGASSFLHLHPRVPNEQMVNLYRRAKVVVVASLIEGKNRSLREAMSSNTPVVCFSAFNRWARGDEPAIPEGAGLCAPRFDAECLADTLHEVIVHGAELTPRAAFLCSGGKRNAFNVVLDAFGAYYETALPGFARTQHHENPWLRDALFASHGKELDAYLYQRDMQTITNGVGITNIRRLLDRLNLRCTWTRH
jgi:glycosyltransferase involved in cell wall biosynthesis